MVVTPSRVIETSLTMVLAEPPLSPDPKLPPADCDDDVADVEDTAEDDPIAVDAVVVTAALADAIALIEIETSSQRASSATPVA
ncbi:hypothetical protein ACRQ5Q_22920 [Bradyrhizobium sp. PMVTL-01]|uniref:hypothetical protein n=1 Tax=Bradyrhizobium sp. PMVTL-01 TaxID=3434999 RepID=UPI003F6EA094